MCVRAHSLSIQFYYYKIGGMSSGQGSYCVNDLWLIHCPAGWAALCNTLTLTLA